MQERLVTEEMGAMVKVSECCNRMQTKAEEQLRRDNSMLKFDFFST